MYLFEATKFFSNWEVCVFGAKIHMYDLSDNSSGCFVLFCFVGHTVQLVGS